jgi:serine/threonine-protein kinase RsbW
MATERILKFSSEVENIHLAEQLIDDVCTEFQVREEFFGEILISLTEAVNNAIVHGNRLDPNKEVTITFSEDGQHMHFTIEDEGAGFDYDSLPDPTAPENIEKPHGRGVFLMRQLADTCEFEDGGRIVKLGFDVIGKGEEVMKG